MAKLKFIHDNDDVTGICSKDPYIEKLKAELMFLFSTRNDIYDGYSGEFIVKISHGVISYLYVNGNCPYKNSIVNDMLIDKVLSELTA